jgi:hypothetical protein
MLVVEFSWQLSGMTVCTTISLAITAHELSLVVSSLATHILIDVDGIDIYYLSQDEKKTKKESKRSI